MALAVGAAVGALVGGGVGGGDAVGGAVVTGGDNTLSHVVAMQAAMTDAVAEV